MNEKIYIQRKYNKCINILLAIYVVLCLVMSLLFNGFFVKTKAFTDGTSFTISYTCITNDNIVSTTDIRYDFTGNTRFIFYSDPDFKELITNKMSGRLNADVDLSCIQIAKTNRPEIYGGSYTTTNVSQVGPYNAFAQNLYFLVFDDDIKEYFSSKGYTFNNIQGYPYYIFFTVNGANIPGVSYKNIGGELLSEDVQYIDTPENLYKYMIQNNDDVVKTGDPFSPIVTEDGNIPTPQKVNLWDSAQNCAGLTWENPNSINKYVKDLGDNVGVEIEWKPSIALTLGMLTVDSLTSSEWLPVYKGVISKSGSLINAFVSKKNDNARLDNNLNGYNYEIDDKFIFTPTLNDNDYLEQIAKNNHVRLWYANEDNVVGGSLNDSEVKSFKKNNINDSNELKTTKNVIGGEVESEYGDEGINVAPSGISKLDLIQGIITGVGKVGKWIFDSFQIDTSNYRVRYYVKDGNNYSVSNWVDARRGYDTNENAKEPTNVNFTDSNNNPVSNPTYLPSNQVTSSDSNSNSWWDRFYNENNNVLANLQTAFANFTTDSGDFFGFFRALFTEFPELYIFLCMGLGLAIMLRILGR